MLSPAQLTFIKDQLYQGQSQDEIKKTLLSWGLSEADIAEAFRRLGKAPQPSSPPHSDPWGN